MYSHLLLTTDGSELSVRAFTAGIALAKTLGARVTGLCVVPEHQVADGLGDVMVGRENATRAAEEFVAAIAAEASRQGVPHECFYVRSASVSDAIIKVATDRGCSLICMGSQGRRGLAGLLLGSDTVGVLTNCTIPLLVYR
jgi:nucleotide-binding universal stress UspA family protein